MVRNRKAEKVAKPTAKMPELLNSSVEKLAPKSKRQRKPTGLYSKTNGRRANARRSDRLRNVTPPARNHEIGPVVEEINLCESDKEDEPQVVENPPGLMSAEKSLEEKMDYFVQPIEELKSKAANGHFQSDSLSGDIKYKRLYIDSQKQIEALTNENHELSKKLEVALVKVEAHAEASRVCSDLLGKLKDVLFLISNMEKANETARNLSSQAVLCRCSSPGNTGDPRAAAKRKKTAKDT